MIRVLIRIASLLLFEKRIFNVLDSIMFVKEVKKSNKPQLVYSHV